VVFDAFGVTEGLSVVVIEGGDTTCCGCGVMEDDGLPGFGGFDTEEDVVGYVGEATGEGLPDGRLGLSEETGFGTGRDARMRGRAEEDEDADRKNDAHTNGATKHGVSRWG